MNDVSLICLLLIHGGTLALSSAADECDAIIDGSGNTLKIENNIRLIITQHTKQ